MNQNRSQIVYLNHFLVISTGNEFLTEQPLGANNANRLLSQTSNLRKALKSVVTPAVLFMRTQWQCRLLVLSVELLNSEATWTLKTTHSSNFDHSGHQPIVTGVIPLLDDLPMIENPL